MTPRERALRAAYARLVTRHGAALEYDYAAFVRSMDGCSIAVIDAVTE